MRIAFVTTQAGYAWGGSEVVWSRAARAAMAAGDSVLAVVFDFSPRAEGVAVLERAGARVIARPRAARRTLIDRIARRVPGGKALLPKRPPWLDALRSFEPALVVVSCGIQWEVLEERELFAWLREEGIPHAVLIHGNSERMFLNDVTRTEMRTALGAARPLIYVSESNRELAERQLAMRLGNAVVVPNSVAARFEQPLPWPRTDPVFAVVGHLDVASKGHDVLFKVLSGRQWSERRWSCRCFGEGRDAAYLRQLVELYGLSGRVELPGHVADPAAIWSGAHLCLVPSRAEGTPMVMLEAYAAGRPAVVTDIGDTSSWTVEGENGFIAEAATPRSFGAAMERAWSAVADWERMGQAAFDRVKSRLDPNPGATLLAALKRG